ADARSGVALCSAPVVVAQEGAGQTIQGSVTDNAGNTANTSVTLKIDKTPPVAAFTTPPPGSVVPGATINFSVSAIDNIGIASVSVSVNGAPVDTRTAAPFSFSFPVAVDTAGGTNEAITVTATDLAGNSAVLQQTVLAALSQLNLSVVPPVSPTFQASES